MGPGDADATFYFDLASPLAYLAAELAPRALGAIARWEPILARELPPPSTDGSALARTGAAIAREGIARAAIARAGTAITRTAHDLEAHAPETPAPDERADVERRAAALGLQPVRWPTPFPFDSEPAMRVATYAAQIGRGIAFAQAAFRQAFAGGRALSDPDWVLVAAAACEMHPRAVLTAMARDSLAEALLAATERAANEGVREVPCVLTPSTLDSGAHAVDRLAAIATMQPPAGVPPLAIIPPLSTEPTPR